MRIADDIREHLRQFWLDAAGSGEVIQGFAFIEPGHFDGPFDGGPVAVDLDATGCPRDRNDAPIKLWRVASVDREFLLAGSLALVERRIVEEGQPHRALDLQHPVGFEEHDRGMGIDPLCGSAADFLVEKAQHCALVLLIDIGHRRPAHGRSTAAPTSLPSRNPANASLA